MLNYFAALVVSTTPVVSSDAPREYDPPTVDQIRIEVVVAAKTKNYDHRGSGR